MAESENIQTHQIETELSRDLGLTSALAIGVGTMIAAGIFTLSGLAVRDVGSAAILSFLLAAIAAACTALSYCEFSSIYPQSGEGYLYSRKTFIPPMAYFVGWSLLLGYTSSCAFYIASLSTYFNEFIYHLPVTQLSGLLFLIGLALLNIKGTKESGAFQIVVTVAKVVMLIWFISGGMTDFDSEIIINRFSTDIGKIGSTAAMVFITFFGFSAIAASAGEVKNPTKNIPRAIFLSMFIVTILYTLVVIVIVIAGLTEYSESAMGTVATKYLGPIGGMVIVGGALFSMISASNASIMAGSRVALSMSVHKHLPEGVGAIDANTKTPIISVLLVSAAIGFFVLMLGLEDLAHFANTVLLFALIAVNVALIMHRRQHPAMERPFRVMLVPLVPLLGIAANIFLLWQIVHHVIPFMLACGALLLGVIGYLMWKGSLPEGDAIPGVASKLAQVRPALEDSQFSILVPIANPDTVQILMEIAVAIAKERNGQIVILKVVQVPEQLPPEAALANTEFNRRDMQQAQEFATLHGVPVTSVIRVGHNIGRAVLETSHKRDCELIILGWRGHTSTARRILGEVVDDVVQHAKADVMLVKLGATTSFKKLLVPTGGGDHARCAEQYAAALAQYFQGEVTACSVMDPELGDKTRAKLETRLEDAVIRMKKDHQDVEISGKIVSHKSIKKGIIKEGANYDGIIIGADKTSIYPEIMFGSIPESVAKQSKNTVIVVKDYHPIKALVGKVLSE